MCLYCVQIRAEFYNQVVVCQAFFEKLGAYSFTIICFGGFLYANIYGKKHDT